MHAQLPTSTPLFGRQAPLPGHSLGARTCTGQQYNPCSLGWKRSACCAAAPGAPHSKLIVAPPSGRLLRVMAAWLARALCAMHWSELEKASTPSGLSSWLLRAVIQGQAGRLRSEAEAGERCAGRGQMCWRRRPLQRVVVLAPARGDVGADQWAITQAPLRRGSCSSTTRDAARKCSQHHAKTNSLEHGSHPSAPHDVSFGIPQMPRLHLHPVWQRAVLAGRHAAARWGESEEEYARGRGLRKPGGVKGRGAPPPPPPPPPPPRRHTVGTREQARPGGGVAAAGWPNRPPPAKRGVRAARSFRSAAPPIARTSLAASRRFHHPVPPACRAPG